MRSERAFRKAKLPAEFGGDLAGSQSCQWQGEQACVSLVLVFARGSAAVDVRLYWRRGPGVAIDVCSATDVSIRGEEPLPDATQLAERLRVHEHAVVEGHSLVRAGYDAWYLEAFPPRERIRPLMTLPAVVEEMQLVDPGMLNGRWEGQPAWDNWATVDIYGGPLTAADAASACAKPVATLTGVLDRLLLPASERLMKAA